MDFSYVITPAIAWLTAGSSKFLINSIRAGKPAFGLIGYGGMPSNHTTIVVSMAVLIALKEGIGVPAFGVAITLAFIVMLDANSLRQQVGKHAIEINKLNPNSSLRERMGHTRGEILGGVICGSLVAVIVHYFPGFI